MRSVTGRLVSAILICARAYGDAGTSSQVDIADWKARAEKGDPNACLKLGYGSYLAGNYGDAGDWFSRQSNTVGSVPPISKRPIM